MRLFTGTQVESQAKCIDLGFTGLAEAQTQEDKEFMMQLTLCEFSILQFTDISKFKNSNHFSN